VVASHSLAATARLDLEMARLAEDYPQPFAAWCRLAPASRQQLATAPATCLRLAEADHDGGRRLTRFLLESVAALAGVDDPSAALPSPAWSPNGDLYVVAGGTESTAPSRFDRTRRYRAARFGRVAVDFFSPYAGDAQEGWTPGLMAHSAAEAEELLRRVEQALLLVYATSWEAATFIDLSLCSLVLRPDPSAPDKAWSGSWSTMIGKAVLANQHLPSSSPAALADAILHESIHSFLYRLERSAAIFALPPPPELSVRSPWTGAELASSSFSHACLVWFGLWSFWRRALAGGSSAVAEGRPLLARAASGFLGPPLVAGEIADCWSPQFADLVDWCQRRVAGETAAEV
ncbi:MAG TPA: HEXXH motif-containing putative peptide modification protein, partial [Thermoanaerobaculia bacterium]|nr:HEXXH motif-containing putative peptide modification protein [Thermoanaerobaculia bacterium]